MILYNNDNNAYCSAVNTQNFETREHKYSINKYILIHKKPIICLHLEIFICIYSVRGDIDQISTNTLGYTMCCAPIVYMFVYILIGAHIVPLKHHIKMYGDDYHIGALH